MNPSETETQWTKKKKKKEMKSIGKLKSKKKRTDEFWTCSQSKTHASQPRVHISNRLVSPSAWSLFQLGVVLKTQRISELKNIDNPG